MKHYDVVAKCGHVKRNRYILKHFYIKASNGKDAARIVRYMPRVKHNHKDAIVSVELINEKEFCEGLQNHSKDMYFICKNICEQRINCPNIYEETIKEKELEPYRKKTHYRKRRIEQIFIKEYLSRREYAYE